MRFLAPTAALFTLTLIGVSCSPDWDGEVAEYALPAEAPPPGDTIKAAPEEERWHACEVIVDEQCIMSFGDCPDRFLNSSRFADSYACAAALRDQVCWSDGSSPPRAYHDKLGDTCVDDIVQASTCDDYAEVFERCDDELWEDSACTKTVAAGPTKLALPEGGASFMWGGSFASVCVEVDAADATEDSPLTVSTSSAGEDDLDTLLWVFGPSGEELDSNDDDPDREGYFSTVSLPDLDGSGRYTVVVAGYDESDAAEFFLDVSLGP